MSKNNESLLDKVQFVCMECGVNASHRHFVINRSIEGDYVDNADIYLVLNKINVGESEFKPIEDFPLDNFYDKEWDLRISVCRVCRNYTIWRNRKVIYPLQLRTPSPSPDMPEDVEKIYKEAQLVYNDSPRSSSALLRLAIEMLLKKLLEGDKKSLDLNGMIKKLNKENTAISVVKALDFIRYMGNKSVHSGEINMEEKTDEVHFLFSLCNTIVFELITFPKRLEENYEVLPKEFKESIGKRDKKSNSTNEP